MEKKVTFKLITTKKGCSLFRGKKKLVSHSGRNARRKCVKAMDIEMAVVQSEMYHKKKSK